MLSRTRLRKPETLDPKLHTYVYAQAHIHAAEISHTNAHTAARTNGAPAFARPCISSRLMSPDWSASVSANTRSTSTPLVISSIASHTTRDSPLLTPPSPHPPSPPPYPSPPTRACLAADSDAPRIKTLPAKRCAGQVGVGDEAAFVYKVDELLLLYVASKHVQDVGGHLPTVSLLVLLVALAEEAVVVVGGCGHEVVGFEAVLCRDDTGLRDPVCECLCVFMSPQY